jgi:hypothetical protein
MGIVNDFPSEHILEITSCRMAWLRAVCTHNSQSRQKGSMWIPPVRLGPEP